MKILKILYCVFVISLAVATFVEWKLGTEFVTKNFYNSIWFMSLLGVLVATSIYFFVKRLKHNIPALLAHSALVIIAVGALLTHLTSVKGNLHLRVQVPQNQFVDSDGMMRKLPETIVLESFNIVNYPGTDTPMDFVSKILISDKDSATVSMNKVVSIDGYRLYQSSFDYDKQGSIFMVNYDPIGIPVTYFGYFLLFGSLISVLLTPNGKFRQIVKKLSLATCLVLFLSSCAKADNINLPPAPSKEQAKEFSKVCVFYHDRIVPLNTYATDFCLKITGKPKYKNLSAEQFLLGWLLYPEKWQYENVIKVKNPLPENCGVKVTNGYTSVAELYDSTGCYKLINSNNKPTKGEIEISDKLQLIISLTEGSHLKIFPFLIDGSIVWCASTDQIPESVSIGQKKMIEEWVKIARTAFDGKDSEVWNLIPLQIARYQLSVCQDFLPSPTIRRIEIAYNKIRPTTWLYRIQLTFGLVLLFLSISQTLKDKNSWLSALMLKVIIVFFVLQLLSLVFRGIISGTIPISNGYETMLFLALSILGVAFFVRRIQLILSSLCVLLSGFCLLVADIAISNPHITPLMPVLHSPWLSIHVMSVMIAYSLFTVITLNAIVALIVARKKDEVQIEKFKNINLVLLYPAIVLLSIGIFIGAIWANESWGTYWSWDPKEVWALITLLVYAVPLHGSLVVSLKKAKNLNIYLLCAFATVLMTYFGVNYLLGGMHSYAG